MTLFDRYLVRRLLVSYLALLAGLIVFFVVLHYVEYIDDFMDRGATMAQVFLYDEDAETLGYYPSYIPEIVRLVSPLALFLSVLFVTARAAQKMELAALQTGGVSLYRLLLPYVLVGVLLSGVQFYFIGYVVPNTNATVLAFEQDYLKDAPRQVDVTNIHRQNAPGEVLFVGYYDQRSQTAHRVTLQTFEEQHLVRRLDAVRMQWIDSLAVWRLDAPHLRRFDDAGLAHEATWTTRDTTLRVLPRDLARTERDVQAMTIPTATNYLDALRRSGADQLGRPLVEYYTKFSYPLAHLIVVLLGMPLAAVRRRGGQSVTFALGLALAFCYLAVMKLAEPFGYEQAVAPLVVAWLPHGLFAVIALLVLWQARK